MIEYKVTVTSVRTFKNSHGRKLKEISYNVRKRHLILTPEVYDSIMDYLGKRYLKGTQITLRVPCDKCIYIVGCFDAVIVDNKEFKTGISCPHIPHPESTSPDQSM